MLEEFTSKNLQNTLDKLMTDCDRRQSMVQELISSSQRIQSVSYVTLYMKRGFILLAFKHLRASLFKMPYEHVTIVGNTSQACLDSRCWLSFSRPNYFSVHCHFKK